MASQTILIGAGPYAADMVPIKIVWLAIVESNHGLAEGGDLEGEEKNLISKMLSGV